MKVSPTLNSATELPVPTSSSTTLWGNGDEGVLKVRDGFIGHNIRHNLGKAGHGKLLVGIVAVHHRIRIQVEHRIGLAVGAVGVVGQILIPAVFKALGRGRSAMALSRQNTDSSAATNRLSFFMVQFLSIVYRCLPTPPKQGWALSRLLPRPLPQGQGVEASLFSFPAKYGTIAGKPVYHKQESFPLYPISQKKESL